MGHRKICAEPGEREGKFMKENRYDDPEFFEKYSQMSRSVQGLSGAGEWPALEKMMPDVENMEILDLGCGYGWHCIYFCQKKAARVIGVDLSEKMLETARKRAQGLDISYRRCAMEDVDFPDNSFDMVFSSLALHYVEDFARLAEKVKRMLKPGGIFCFPVSTRYLPPRAARTGFMMRREGSAVFRWTVTTIRESGTPFSWESMSGNTTGPSPAI